MAISVKKLKFSKQFSLFVSISLLLFSFNNCSDISLVGLAPNSSSGEKNSTFPLPTSQTDEYRIVFFVDMSLSMVAGLCKNDAGADADDIAWVVPDGSPFCTRLGVRLDDSGGADPSGIRLSVMKNWIIKIRDFAANPSRVKFLIVPFTGGKAELQRDQTDNLTFVDADTALAITEALLTEQLTTRDALEYPLQAGEAPHTKMGTSTPIKRLEKLRTIATTEATAIRDAGQRSFFEIVLVSDGVPKPRIKHIYNSVVSIWKTEGSMRECPTWCGADLMNYLEGTASIQQIRECGIAVDSRPTHDIKCFKQNVMSQSFSILDPYGGGNDVLTHMQSTWGDYVGNTPNKIVLKIDAVKKSLSAISGVNVRISSAFVFPNRTSHDVRNSLENWIIRSKEQKVVDRIGYISSPDMPFSLIDIGDSLEAYRIGSLMILNPYVRINNQGVLIKDSDGDGLPDDQDPFPQNPRGMNGKCLDSLVVQNRCPSTLACDAQLDEDGDGLNECEELILNTKSLDFDSDDDSIPDSMEYLFSYDANQNDLNETNVDGQTNVENFKMGVPRSRRASQISPNFLIRFQVNEVGYIEQAPLAPQTGLYDIQVQQVPVAIVQASQGATLFYDRTHIQQVPTNILNRPHEQNKVPLTILVRIDNTLNTSDVRWAQQVIQVDSSGQTPIQIDLQQLEYFKAPDPQMRGF